jgi:hypothetical protein
MSSVPVTGARPKARPRARRKSLVSSQSTAKITTFLIIVGVTYLVSSLTGQVMVEKARREGISASGRALEARKVEAELGKRLDMLTSFASVDEWAKTHNFLPPDQLAGNPDTAAPLVAGEAAKPTVDGIKPEGTSPLPAVVTPVPEKKRRKKAKVKAGDSVNVDTSAATDDTPKDSQAEDSQPQDDGIRHNDAPADTTDDVPAPVALPKHHHRKHKVSPKEEVLDVQAR